MLSSSASSSSRFLPFVFHQSRYPNGIEPTVQHIHSLGLGYGTYGDRGTLDCDRRPGQLGHESQDAAYEH